MSLIGICCTVLTGGPAGAAGSADIRRGIRVSRILHTASDRLFIPADAGFAPNRTDARTTRAGRRFRSHRSSRPPTIAPPLMLRLRCPPARAELGTHRPRRRLHRHGVVYLLARGRADARTVPLRAQGPLGQHRANDLTNALNAASAGTLSFALRLHDPPDWAGGAVNRLDPADVQDYVYHRGALRRLQHCLRRGLQRDEPAARMGDDTGRSGRVGASWQARTAGPEREIRLCASSAPPRRSAAADAAAPWTPTGSTGCTRPAADPPSTCSACTPTSAISISPPTRRSARRCASATSSCTAR